MAVKPSQQLAKPLTYSLLIGLLALIVWLYLKWRNQPERVIRREFAAAGVDPQVINYWVAVAKHETAGFTSRVFREGNNMFGMKPARGENLAIGQLPYGEGQAIFKNLTDSARDQILYFTKRFRYPKTFPTLKDFVRYMKSRGYFESDESEYYEAVKKWL